jgi:hypothetical protein
MHDEDVTHARRAAASFEGERVKVDVKAALRRYVDRYGWRAYALPVLVVVTFLALANLGTAPRPPRAAAAAPPAPRVTPSSTPSAAAVPPNSDSDVTLASDALPSGAAYTTQGAGTFRVLPGQTRAVGTGRVWRYSIDVEDGVTGIELTRFATLVQNTLADPRSWSGHGVAVQRVDSGRIDFHVTLTSAMTVRQLCGYDLKIETSCYAMSGSVAGLAVNRVVLNDARWVRGDVSYLHDLAGYHVYMINHETGHALGHAHAHACLADGLAPVMMQQTIGLRSGMTGQTCRANPWPFPAGATDAPGAEQADTTANAPVRTMTVTGAH